MSLADFLAQFLPQAIEQDGDALHQFGVAREDLAPEDRAYAEVLACLGVLTMTDTHVQLADGPPEHARWLLRSLHAFAVDDVSALGSLASYGRDVPWSQVLRLLEVERLRRVRILEHREPIRKQRVAQLCLIGECRSVPYILLAKEILEDAGWSTYKLPGVLLDRSGEFPGQRFARLFGAAIQSIATAVLPGSPFWVRQISASAGAFTEYSTEVYEVKDQIRVRLAFHAPRDKFLGWMRLNAFQQDHDQRPERYFPVVFQSEAFRGVLRHPVAQYSLEQSDLEHRLFEP